MATSSAGEIFKAFAAEYKKTPARVKVDHLEPLTDRPGALHSGPGQPRYAGLLPCFNAVADFTTLHTHTQIIDGFLIYALATAAVQVQGAADSLQQTAAGPAVWSPVSACSVGLNKVAPCWLHLAILLAVCLHAAGRHLPLQRLPGWLPVEPRILCLDRCAVKQ